MNELLNLPSLCRADMAAGNNSNHAGVRDTYVMASQRGFPLLTLHQWGRAQMLILKGGRLAFDGMILSSSLSMIRRSLEGLVPAGRGGGEVMCPLNRIK